MWSIVILDHCYIMITTDPMSCYWSPPIIIVPFTNSRWSCKDSQKVWSLRTYLFRSVSRQQKDTMNYDAIDCLKSWFQLPLYFSSVCVSVTLSVPLTVSVSVTSLPQVMFPLIFDYEMNKNIAFLCFLSTSGVDLSKILGGNQNIGGKRW